MTNQEPDELKPLTSFRIDKDKDKTRTPLERRVTDLPDSSKADSGSGLGKGSTRQRDAQKDTQRDAQRDKAAAKGRNTPKVEGKSNYASSPGNWISFLPWVGSLLSNSPRDKSRQKRSKSEAKTNQVDKNSKAGIDQTDQVAKSRKSAPQALPERRRRDRPPSQSPLSQSPLSKPPLSKPPLSKPPLSKPPLSKPPLSKPPLSQAPLSQAPSRISARRSSSTPPPLPPLNTSFSRRQPGSPVESTTKTPANPKSPKRFPKDKPPKDKPREPKEKKQSAVVYGLRLLIVGVGLGAIAGTVLYVFDPATRPSNNTVKVEANLATPKTPSPSNSPVVAPLMALKLQQEIPALQGQLEALIKARPNLQTGVFLQDLDNGSFVNILGDTPLAAASTIKIAILIAFFQDVDAGKVTLGEQLTLEKKFVAGGSGELQDQPLGTKYATLDVATRMMVTSDNTATNMMIDRLGGLETLNQRFQGWGLKNTSLQAVLPDLEGTNLTTPKELATLLRAIEQGEVVSRRSRDLILGIMRRTENDSLLPQGLEKNVAIAHKTGSLGTLIADAGLIDMPNGKQYLLVVIVKRPRNDPQGVEIVRQISRTVYSYFKQLSAPKKP